MSPSSEQPVVVVTGGGSGIGLAMTRYFAASACRVVVLDVNDTAGSQATAQLASELPGSVVTFAKCDVSSWQEQAAAFHNIYRDHGRVDIVMANAGISGHGAPSLTDLDAEAPVEPGLDVLRVNLIGVIYTVKLAIHYMRKTAAGLENPPGGLIVCTASNAGLYPFPMAPLYASSKSGIVGLVRSLARPLHQANIRINALAPSVLETNIASDKAMFKEMTITPMLTLICGVEKFVQNRALSGEVAEIHGQKVTIRPAHEYVDADSERNIETFWKLGYA